MSNEFLLLLPRLHASMQMHLSMEVLTKQGPMAYHMGCYCVVSGLTLFLGARQGAAAPMFPFEDAGGEAGWDAYGGPVCPGDFGATGLAAGASLWRQIDVNMHILHFEIYSYNQSTKKGCRKQMAWACNRLTRAARFLRPARA